MATRGIADFILQKASTHFPVQHLDPTRNRAASALGFDPTSLTPDIYFPFEDAGEGSGGNGVFVNQGSLSFTATCHSASVDVSTSSPYSGSRCAEFNNGSGSFGYNLSGSNMFDFNEAIFQYAIKPRTSTWTTGNQVHFCWDTDLNNRLILYIADMVPTLYVRRGGGTAVVFPSPPSAVTADQWSLWRWEFLAGNITLFIDGVQVATVADPGAGSGYRQSTFGNPVEWGRVAFAGDAWFVGVMDHFKLWRVS